MNESDLSHETARPGAAPEDTAAPDGTVGPTYDQPEPPAARPEHQSADYSSDTIASQPELAHGEIPDDAGVPVGDLASSLSPYYQEPSAEIAPLARDADDVPAATSPEPYADVAAPTGTETQIAASIPDARRWSLPFGWRVDVPLVLMLAVAAILRIYGYNWDEGTILHPDERGIGGIFLKIDLPHSWAEFWSPSSPLNPHYSNYGNLPFYATLLLGHFLSFWGHLLDNLPLIGSAFAGLAQADQNVVGIIQTGRVLSALSDTAALLFVYLIARLVYNRSAGLLAVLLGTFTVLNLEFSHFALFDTDLTFFIAGALYFCVRIVRFGRPRDYIWAGAWIGFALACKISAAPLIVPLIVAHIFRGTERHQLVDALSTGAAALRTERLPVNPLLLLLALVSAAAGLFVTMPYFYIDFANWWPPAWYQLQLAQGINEQPFTRKFSGLPSYSYPLQQLVGWSLGLPLGLAAVAGTLAALIRQIRLRRGSELVLLAWVIVFFASAGGQYMKFLRYMLPLVPVLNLFAAVVLVAAWRYAARRIAETRHMPLAALAARILVVAVVGLTVLYGLARENIYTAENTRLAATRWMFQHIPAGTPVMNEGAWDESIPWGLPGPSYQPVSVDLLGAADDATKVQQMVQMLQTSQYITISSARVFGSVAHQPGRYPYTIRWYELLFSNKLNFHLEKSFLQYPHLGPISIDDSQPVPHADQYTHIHLWYPADQNYSEYDSPPVYIFKRDAGTAGAINSVKATAMLTHDAQGHLLQPQLAAYDPSHSMLLSSAVNKADQQAPALGQVFPADNPLAKVPLLSWWLMVELLGLLALPLVMRACRNRLRDGGYGLAKVCGIVIVGWFTWIAASVHIATYNRGLILLSCLLLLLVSLAVGLRPRELWAELRARRGGILWAEGVFIVAFLAMAGVRMLYPDLWHMTYGGERTQEVSFMNSILRSQYFPPADPWFAGGTLNYYYYGQYLMGMLMKLIGIGVPVGFNLAFPMLYALLLSVAFSIGYNATGRRWVGIAAVLLEGVFGNLYPIQQLAALAPAHASSFLPMVAGLRDAFSGLVAILTGQVRLLDHLDFFWGASRNLSVTNGDAINEFPIWSFTYGDMHAHVIDMPIVLTVIGLALAASGLGIERRPNGPTRPAGWDGPLGLLALIGLMVVVAGATGPTNLWDLPTSVAILTVAFGLNGWFVARRRGWALVLRDLALPGAVVGAIAYLLYRPFYSSVLGISSGFTFLQPHTPTDQWIIHFGIPLFLLVSFVLYFLARRVGLADWLERRALALEFQLYYREHAAKLPRLFRVVAVMTASRRQNPTLLSAHMLLFGLLLATSLWVVGFDTLALTTLIGVPLIIALIEAGARMATIDPADSQPFALSLAIMGLTLTAIPDFIMQNEAGRMNTFFKLYNQAWPMLALSGALALFALVRMRRQAVTVAEERPARALPQISPLRIPRPATAPLLHQLALAPMAAGAGDGSGSWWTDAREPEHSAIHGAFEAPEDDDAHSTPDSRPGPDAVAASDNEPGKVEAVVPAGEDENEDREAGERSAYGALEVHEANRIAADESPGSTAGEAEPLSGVPAASADDDMFHVPGDIEAVDHGEPPVSSMEARSEAPTGDTVIVRAPDGGLWRWATLWWAALVALACGGLLYPIFGIFTHVNIRQGWGLTAQASIPQGLDGAAFVKVLYPQDWAAIQWVNDNVHGMPVLLTSDRGGYRDFATKVTMFTGLPTIDSWDGEDRQERYSGQARPASQYPNNWVDQFVSGAVTWNGRSWMTNLPKLGSTATGTRANDVETIYNTPNPTVALQLLHEYHVSLIYVGTAERGDPDSGEAGAFGRNGFDPAGLAKFDTMVTAHQLGVAYRNPGVTIYRVL